MFLIMESLKMDRLCSDCRWWLARVNGLSTDALDLVFAVLMVGLELPVKVHAM